MRQRGKGQGRDGRHRSWDPREAIRVRVSMEKFFRNRETPWQRSKTSGVIHKAKAYPMSLEWNSSVTLKLNSENDSSFGLGVDEAWPNETSA